MMNHQQITQNTWNKVANLYDQKFMQLSIYNSTYDFLCQQFNTTAPRVLDIGCGPGNISQYIIKQLPNAKVEGIDYASNMIELAAKNNPTATFSVMDCRAIHQLSKGYDGIIAGFCLPYLSPDEVNQLFTNSYNLLNSAGILYVSFVDGAVEDSGLITGSTGDSTYFYYHPTENMLNLFTKNNFELIQQFDIPYSKNDGSTELHTILIATKK
jgi:trans-aconitate methyltransferase